MRIFNRFTDREKELLENIGVELTEREYSDFEIADIGDQIMSAVMNNLDNEGEFTDLADEYNTMNEKIINFQDEMLYESDEIRLRPFVAPEQAELLEQNNINLDRTYNLSDLEHLEDLVYDIMMSKMDENGEYTEEAEKYEKIIDVIVKIENEM